MEWFINVLGATLGLGIGATAFVAAIAIIQILHQAAKVALDEGAMALRRYAHRDEVVIEDYYESDMRREVRYIYPTPERVKLAKHGKAGERLHRKRAA